MVRPAGRPGFAVLTRGLLAALLAVVLLGSPARAQSVGLGVNAGHDLSQVNLRAFLSSVPQVLEVSIGHALIDEALYAGLDATVRAYVAILDTIA